MTHVRVALVTLILMGCAPKPSAPPARHPGRPRPARPARRRQSYRGPRPLHPRAAPGSSPRARRRRQAPRRRRPPRPPSGPRRPGVTRAGPRARGSAPTVKVLYVKTHLANLREGGGTGTKILRVLRQGTRLEVLEERQEWYRVHLEDSQEGWVAASVGGDGALGARRGSRAPCARKRPPVCSPQETGTRDRYGGAASRLKAPVLAWGTSKPSSTPDRAPRSERATTKPSPSGT